MDFLTVVPWGIYMNDTPGTTGKWVCKVGGGEDGYGETPRKAIDAAMRKEKKSISKGEPG